MRAFDIFEPVLRRYQQVEYRDTSMKVEGSLLATVAQFTRKMPPLKLMRLNEFEVVKSEKARMWNPPS